MLHNFACIFTGFDNSRNYNLVWTFWQVKLFALGCNEAVLFLYFDAASMLGPLCGSFGKAHHDLNRS